MKTRNVVVIGMLTLLAACKSDTKEVTVEAEDTAGPVLSSSTPNNESDNVEVNVQISLYFNELLGTEIPNSSVQLRLMGTDDLISVAVDIKGSALIITPAETLGYEQEYYVESDYEIIDSAGNSIDTPVYISFTTQEAPIIAIDSLTEGQTISGVVNITGTANEQVKQVLVKVSDSGFVEASGITNWSLTLDSSDYNDGLVSVIAKATNGYWDISEQTIQVNISNVDPIVGTWNCSNSNGYSGTQWFSATGSMNDDLFSCWVSGWTRDGENIIVNRSNCSNLSFKPIFTNNNNTLQINEATYWTGGATCTRAN